MLFGEALFYATYHIEHPNESMNSRLVHSKTVSRLATVLLIHSMLFAGVSLGQEDDAAMAAYADAANFQTGGAIDLAVQAWNQFLKDHPDHELASQAQHYLGVCHMQSEAPDYDAASKAFGKALQNKTYKLREESLANRGWCLYSSVGTASKSQLSQRDARKLKQTIQNFNVLRNEFPESRFLDRAIFYSGEAAFGMGQTRQAIDHYNDLLSMQKVKDSPLRCDALYARGVAHEGLENFDDAVASYRQLIDQCKDSKLITDVQLRLGDVQILRQEFDEAIIHLDQAYKTAESNDEKSYALFRQAYAHVLADRPADAAAKYEELLSEYPKSEYAATAMLASAQSTYRSGNIDQAAKRFTRVLGGTHLADATEAAHWLARIELSRSRLDSASEIVRNQIQRGAEGKFATELRMDLAEILSMDAETADEAMQLFERVYREDIDAPLAARALYNAAFSALQTGQHKHAFKLATEFLDRYPSDALRPEIQFIAAESLLADQKPKAAADQYKDLIESTSGDHLQRPAWLLRCAIALNASRRYDETIELLGDEVDSIGSTEQSAEAFQLLGRANIRSGNSAAAVKSLQSSIQAAPKWRGVNQSRLLLGQAYASSGNTQAATEAWSELIQTSPTSVAADQARYKIAQVESGNGNFDRAMELYQEILDARKSTQIVPHAQYGKAWTLMQEGKFKPATDALSAMIQGDEDHPLQDDAVLARGICYRNLGEYDQAKSDLESYLTRSPTGTNLGHALYELALIDQKDQAPDRAAKKLQRLVAEVPDYPSMDKVLYELGWSLQESGNAKDAATHFSSLVSKYPDTGLAADAAYYIGQNHYAAKEWEPAAKRFSFAAKSEDDALAEKALYRLGWSQYQLGNLKDAENAFTDQFNQYPDGDLAFDATAMVAECRFKRGEFKEALTAYSKTRESIRVNDETSSSIRDDASRKVRELALLHGGQSAGQLEQWDTAIDWHNEHRERFPSSNYLSQVFYEIGFANHQKGDTKNAIKFYTQVADKYRNEMGARARFMIGEIYFGERDLGKAIPEFQRVMFGYGADKAPAEIKNWQAKSGFEAGRCSEALMQSAKTKKSKRKAQEFCKTFYSYVVEEHPDHEVAVEASRRLEAMSE